MKKSDVKKFVFASDSFKGSLTSGEIAELLTTAAKKQFPTCECVPFWIADGGEGTLEAILSQKEGKIVYVTVENPLGEKIEARYGVFEDTAIICMSEASGLPLIRAGQRNARLTSTYGTGELMRHAIESGYKKLYVTLGGSATNDGGTGALSALGYRFLDKDGLPLKGRGEDLINIAMIDGSSAVDFSGIETTLLCDVSNPLLGETGATYTYGRQKGASDSDLAFLERGMENFARAAREYCGVSLDVSGGGAAGGIGGALYAFCGAKMQSGIDAVLTIGGFDELVKDATLVVTGEGRVDFQSANGKAIDGILARANKFSVPVVAIAGSVGEGADKLYEKGLTAVYSIINKPMPLEDALKNAKELYLATAQNVFRTLKVFL